MSDREKFQGKWRVIFKSPKEMIIPINESTIGAKVLYTLFPERDPKQIDMEHKKPRARPRPSAKGIYSLEGDTLRIHWVHEGKRPGKISNQAASSKYLLVLKRVE